MVSTAASRKAEDLSTISALSEQQHPTLLLFVLLGLLLFFLRGEGLAAEGNRGLISHIGELTAKGVQSQALLTRIIRLGMEHRLPTVLASPNEAIRQHLSVADI